MSYKCAACGINDVDELNETCQLCAIGQDPYASAMNGRQITPDVVDTPSSSNTYQSQGTGRSRKVLLNGGLVNTDPYGNDMTPSSPVSNVKVYKAGKAPVSATNTTQAITTKPNTPQVTVVGVNQPLTSGIIKNLQHDVLERSAFKKWAQAFFSGIPYTLDNSVSNFQVFPDFTGTSINISGNACDQVMIYGKVAAGAISENNDVDVYGKRNSDNILIAKTIRNKASGTTISANRVISADIIRIITFLIMGIVIGILFGGFSLLSVLLLLLAQYGGSIAIMIALVAALYFLLKKNKRFALWLFIGIGVYAIFVFIPGLWSQLLRAAVTIGVIYIMAKGTINIFKK